MNKASLVECPRDAMQGWKHFIPTGEKIRYINSLLKVGFDTIDFGSFVSSKAIPQMADTTAVLKRLQLEGTRSKLLAIIANVRGAEDAVRFDTIHYLGFPFSISPTFQQRNTNSSMEESLVRVEEIQQLCQRNGKELVIYLSMGFGNPYGDPYDDTVLLQWADEMVNRGIKIISLADTVGVAAPKQILTAVTTLVSKYPDTTVGVHLHSTHQNWREKLDAAVAGGCTRFDGALKGIGGCPMAGDDLVGNMDTERMLGYFRERQMLGPIDEDALSESLIIASEIFGQ